MPGHDTVIHSIYGVYDEQALPHNATIIDELDNPNNTRCNHP